MFRIALIAVFLPLIALAVPLIYLVAWLRELMADCGATHTSPP